MSRTSQSAAATVFTGAAPPDYRLKSDLAQCCLPSANRDEARRLAYVNSICLVFLVTGLLGVRRPDLITREPEPPVARILVEKLEPTTAPPPSQEAPPPDETSSEPPPVDAPVVAVAVAPPDAKLAFPVAIDINVPVAFVPGRFAPPPPRELPKAPSTSPLRFNRGTRDGGYYPPPLYPGLAQRRGLEGEAVVWIRVDEAGQVTSVELKKTSGHDVLDQAALAIVRERWRFPAGAERFLEWTCAFQLSK